MSSTCPETGQQVPTSDLLKEAQDLEASLFSLESILDEFYSPCCTNDRRKQIDDVLSRFFQQQTCLQQALFFLGNSNQDYTRTFAINILQACVCYNWPRYNEAQKSDLKFAVRRFLFENAQSSQYYVLNKLCKLIADIARCEWPEKDPEYFNYIMGFISHQETQLAGLTLLRATFEEFITPKETMSVARRALLAKFLLESVPNVLQFLVQLMSTLHQSRDKKYEKSLISECLQTLTQMLTWIPLANNLNNQLVMILLGYCQIPSCAANGQNYQPGDDSLSLLAMDCLNEIMAKKCVPKDTQSFLVTIFHHSMSMIDINNSYPESFLSKLVFFLQLLASSQFARFEALEGFPMEHFLTQLLSFTFRQDISEIYLSCLEVWSAILEHLKSTVDKREPNGEIDVLYRATVKELCSKILSKVTFAANQTFLDEIDDETLDDDKETDYEKFQRINLELIALSSDLYAPEILSAVNFLFSSLLQDFKTIVTCIHKGDENVTYQLLIKGEYDNLRLHCKVRDLATICRLIGMINGTFFSSMQVSDSSDECLPRKYLSGLVFICKTNLQFSLYKIEGAGLSETLHSDFSNLLALSLGAKQLMINWLSAFLGQVVKLENNEALEEIQNITNECFEMAHEIIETFDSSKAVFSRLLSQIVFSHASTVKAIFLLKLPSFYNLIKSTLSSNFSLLPLDVQCKFAQSVCCGIIASWAYSKNLSTDFSNWESRVPILSSWISELFGNFHMLAQKQTLSAPELKEIERGLALFTSILMCLPGEVKRTREICLEHLHPLIEDVLVLSSNHFSNPALCGQILDGYHSILECLKSQLGPDKISLIINSLINQLTPEKVQQIFCRKSSDLEIEIISKFVKTLMRIAEEPSKKFMVFLPGIITFVCETIAPLINQENYYSPDCITSMLDLLFQILKVHWSKFFDESEGSVTRDHFVSLVQIFGQCLLFPDINVYKHAINALQRLNEVFQLYNNEIFRTKLRDSFLMLLMTQLLERNQLLNEEETLQGVHSLALVDFSNFRGFLLQFFVSKCQDVPQNEIEQRMCSFASDTDLPTFSSSLSQLTAEMNYMKSLYAPTDPTAINFTNLTQ